MANQISRRRSMELPEGVVGEILDRLPIKSLIRFQIVCKPWLSLISNTQFLKSHLRRALSPTILILEKEMGPNFRVFDIDLGVPQMVRQPNPRVRHRSELDSPVRFQHIGMPKNFPFLGASIVCCNGIICFSDHINFYIWNPLLNHYKKLPLPERRHRRVIDNGSTLPLLGFGYDPISKDYKVLRFVSKIHNGYDPIVQLYSSNADSWREFTDPILTHWKHCSQAHVVVNGVMYFDGVRDLQGGLSFNLHEEVFGQVSFPSFATENKSQILDFEGSVAMVFKCSGDEDEFTLCTLDTVSGTWTKMFNLIAGLRLNLYFGAGQFYGHLHGGPEYESCNVIYDYEKKEAYYYRPPLPKGKFHYVLKYKESLVSLKGFEEVKSNLQDQSLVDQHVV